MSRAADSKHERTRSQSARRGRARRGRRRRAPPGAVRRGARIVSAAARALWVRVFRKSPRSVRIAIGGTLALALLLTANWVAQVVRKPSELWFPLSAALYKTPAETWRDYGALFRLHSTRVMTPELLAALAQVEAAGNPIARTYWRWALRLAPLDIYRPASSGVGLYQMTDGAFAEARHYCVHRHVVVEDGPWNALHSCWFNALYTRIIPSHAIELTSAFLSRRVADILARESIAGASLEQRQALAMVIQLCGEGAAAAYAERGFRFAAGQRCGAHSPRAYIHKVEALQAVFKRLE